MIAWFETGPEFKFGFIPELRF